MKTLSLYEGKVCGATAIEYALIVGGIAVAISAVVFAVGTDLTDMFQGLADQLGSAIP